MLKLYFSYTQLVITPIW